MSISGNKKLVRLLVALFGGKKPDWTGPENTMWINICFCFDSLQRWIRDTQCCKMQMVLIYKGLHTVVARNLSKSG